MSGEEGAYLLFRVLRRRLVVFEPVAEITDAGLHLRDRSNRFGSPLVLSRVHWVRPELVAEVKYLTWTEDNLLRPYARVGPTVRLVPVSSIRCRRRWSRSAVPDMSSPRSTSQRHIMSQCCKNRSDMLVYARILRSWEDTGSLHSWRLTTLTSHGGPRKRGCAEAVTLAE
jgi:hypothetical protein